jgi:hypothetical protein
VIRQREVWMIPLAALGEGGTDVLHPLPEELERDQLPDPI